VKGSPVSLSEQEHDGVWFITVQIALNPHAPRHGSRHFSCMQALLLGHSELIVHSGRQFGGDPVYVGKHEHDGDPLISRH
jgi:hypothetical protein